MPNYILPSVIETVDSTSTNPYTIAVGQTAQGMISDSADYDYFRVSVIAGQTYAISLVGTGVNSLNDPYLSVLNSSGSVLAWNDNIASRTRWSQLICTPSSTGILTIRAQSYSGSSGGQYGLSVSSGSQHNFDYLMGAGALHQASDGVWGSGNGEAATVTYGFRQTAASYTDSSAINTFTQLSAVQISAVRTILGLWSDVCGITFQEVNPGGYTNNATILIGSYQDAYDGAGAFAYFPGTDTNSSRGNTASSSRDGDVWLNRLSVRDNNIGQGGYGFSTIMHEIGHAIGLSHPGPYNAASGVSNTYTNDARFVQDSGQYTLMSYFDGSNTGQSPGYLSAIATPMMFDIVALQNIYGANISTRTSNTIYGFGSNAGSTYDFSINSSPQICIWDAGGTDTLNCSGYSQNQTINLTAGNFSDVGGQISNVSIALNVTIENAIGGSGNDVITGNSANNDIQGGNGSDTLAGGDGNDIIHGGVGNDTFDWGASYRAGNDIFYGGTGNDIYVIDSASGDVIVEYVNEGTDTIWAEITFSLAAVSNVENLSLFGAGNINATGNSLNNVLTGNSGNNALTGGLGGDSLYGGAGDDTYWVDSTSDLVVENANEGTDTVWVDFSYSLAAVSNVENLSLFGTGNINATGNSLNNTLAGNSLNNLINGMGGNDAINGGSGIDTAVYTGTAASYTLTLGTSSSTIMDRTANRDGADTLVGVERLKFSDTNIALDVQAGENAGMAYRMYKAALNRAPDLGGLGDWIGVLDNGANIFTDLARGFTESTEFKTRYGPNLSNSAFVTLLYNNVLGRDPDQGGLNAWVGAIEQRGATREVVLHGFSESTENIRYSQSLIGQGMPYID